MTDNHFDRVPALAQFNKVTKVFVMILQRPDDISGLNHDFYLYREIEIDRDKEKVIGNYDNFRVAAIEHEPLEINEDALNTLAREKILKRYPMHDQLTILGLTLEKIADSVGIECEDLKEMNDFISEVRRLNGLRKEFYASDPAYRYMSTEEFEELFVARREGGVMQYEPTAFRPV